jgi:membrane protease YdiL (CAAX protease family)
MEAQPSILTVGARKTERYGPWLALALLVLAGAYLASEVVSRLAGVRGAADMTAARMAVGLGVRELTALVLSIFGAFAVLRSPLSAIGIRAPRRIDLEYGFGIGAFATVGILTLLFYLRLPSSAYGDFTQYVMLHATGFTALALFLIVGIFSPIVQEIVFRGIVMEGLLRKTNVAIALLISTMLFSAVHWAGGANQVVFTLLTGSVQGWLYWRTRSIVAPSIMHVIANCIAALALLARI